MKRLIVVAAGLLFAGVVAAAGWFVLGGGSGGNSIPVPMAPDDGERPQSRIGGPFTLVDQDGRQVTEADFRGRYRLIFFGYTYSPDVVPTTLTHMGTALEALGEEAEKVVPIFVTIDPERDTPQALKDYLAYFHPRMVGLTGTPQQVRAMARSYRVYYAKVHEDGRVPVDYAMDHTSLVYLMGPDGRYIDHFPHGADPGTMARRIQEALRGG